MGQSQRTERGFDRIVNFSDAVVAIAITLNILPLMDLQTEDGSEGTWALLQSNTSVFFAFFTTFLLTAMYWLIHHRIFEYIGDYDSTLTWLNMGWLVLIIFLPFLSSQWNENSFGGGTGTLYCLTLAGLSILLGLISRHVRNHPQLLVEDADRYALGGLRSWVMSAYLILVAPVAWFWPDLAGYLMFGLVFVSMAMRRVDTHNHPGTKVHD